MNPEDFRRHFTPEELEDIKRKRKAMRERLYGPEPSIRQSELKPADDDPRT